LPQLLDKVSRGESKKNVFKLKKDILKAFEEYVKSLLATALSSPRPHCCAVAYFSKHALLLRFHSSCNALIYGTLNINNDYIFGMWVKQVFSLFYEGIAFRLCRWNLFTSSGPYAQVL